MEGLNGVYQRKLRELLNDLDIEDRYSILFILIYLRAKAALKGVFLVNGRYKPIRMMVIYGVVFPISLWVHQPSVGEPLWNIFKAWIWAIIAMLGLYRLMPI